MLLMPVMHRPAHHPTSTHGMAFLPHRSRLTWASARHLHGLSIHRPYTTTKVRPLGRWVTTRAFLTCHNGG
ncbi:hypothetical protein M419DRAFT_121998 [Trichoderma reesei RUT C-30]|uniref:Uncharacterized protein n=1 Tax=Hypocrea jecorina (strain ATCC 56765 / BCRC 32924 / NRRL 11460 / Rut C-30) TaxID=1344414 RepID=A0A024SLE0_HYPJR|nr:hypothetical protein M419DRAFT_121998 [Trichoderma reesei RUT C-30]